MKRRGGEDGAAVYRSQLATVAQYPTVSLVINVVVDPTHSDPLAHHTIAKQQAQTSF